MHRKMAVSILLLGLALALPAVFERNNIEGDFRSYELVIDYEGLQSLARAEEADLYQLAQELAQAGATGLSVPVQTVAGLLAQGGATYREGRLELPPGIELERELTPLDFPRVFAGPDPQALEIARSSGLRPVLRLSFLSRVTASEVLQALETVKGFSGETVIFEGEAVLGYPGHLSRVDAAVKDLQLNIGLVEFTSQKGINRLAEDNPDQLVRVHTITPEETDLVGFDRAKSRWIRAVAERNIRLLYLHPYLPESVAVHASGVSPRQLTVEMVQGITRGLADVGFAPGRPALLPGLGISLSVFGGGLLALLGGAYLVLSMVLERWWGQKLAIAGWAIGILVAFALLLLYGGGWSILASQVVALGVAVIFPALSILLAEGTSRLSRGLITAVAVTFAGVILVVAVLAQSPFMLKTQQFLGVKLMHILPPAIVGWVFWQRGYFRKFSLNRVTLVLIPVVALGAGYLILRTGNIGAVSDLERTLRDALENLLVVRPRTKEFLLGHPALVLGLWLRHRGNLLYSAALLVIGSIGQLSLLNTFTHIHTPLEISLVRSVNGLWIGLLLGGLAILAYAGFLRVFGSKRGKSL